MTRPIPEGFHTLTPHITVKGADQAIAFYAKAFGAEELVRHEMGGAVGYAQLRLGSSMLMLNEEYPDQGSLAPPPQGGGVVLHLYVEDVDAAFARAVGAGAQPIMPVADMFWGDRFGVVQDPYGHRWSIATHKQDLTPQQIEERAAQAFAQG